MPKFILEDVPDDLVEDLMSFAKEERRTLEQQILYMLEESMRQDLRERRLTALYETLCEDPSSWARDSQVLPEGRLVPGP